MTAVMAMESVPVDTWHERVHQVKQRGFGFFDFLTAVDRNSFVEVVVHLVREDLSDSYLISTMLSNENLHIDSIETLFPGAGWHEREVGEMFGVKFEGNDMQKLLRHETLGLPPLRKNIVLSARVVTEWPGAAEPEIKQDGRKVGNPSRRRQRPPGAPESWLQS
jgi:NADH-quinone oxidoreductase subunit C